MRERLYACVVSALVLGAVLAPVTYEPGRDGFPLSPYPMFARAKSSPVVRLHYFVGHDREGGRHAISPSLVANAEVLQARAVIAGAVRRGREAALSLCRRVAERVAADDELGDVAFLTVVHGTHDAVAFLADGERGKETVVARCEVPRP